MSITVTGIAALKDVSAKGTSVVPVTRWEEIGQLAASLFDLRSAYEANLRTLTAVQRSLERVRRVDALACEADLLLGEMARALDQLQTTSPDMSETLETAARHLDAVRSIGRSPASPGDTGA